MVSLLPVPPPESPAILQKVMAEGTHQKPAPPFPHLPLLPKTLLSLQDLNPLLYGESDFLKYHLPLRHLLKEAPYSYLCHEQL